MNDLFKEVYYLNSSINHHFVVKSYSTWLLFPITSVILSLCEVHLKKFCWTVLHDHLGNNVETIQIKFNFGAPDLFSLQKPHKTLITQALLKIKVVK